MSLPIAANTTCDIFRAGATTPASTGVPCMLIPDFEAGRMQGQGEADILRFTHRMRVAVNTDIRDDLSEFSGNVHRDTIFIPDQHGVGYLVTFVERLGRGTWADHKHVYLNRLKPS